MKSIFIQWLTISVLSFVCQPSIAQTNEADSEPKFEMISIPLTLRSPKDRAEYLVKHYWDRFDFNDIRHISHSKEAEQALANYLDLKNHVSMDVMSSSIKETLKKAEVNKKMFSFMAGLIEKYLYEPESPLEDDELLISALEYITEESSIDEAEKIRPAMLLKLVLNNRIGTTAANFKYKLADGTTGKLHDIESDYLILFFNDPDCLQCNETSEQMSHSFVVNDFIKRGILKVLSLYPYDNVAGWRSHQKFMPKEWINSYDNGCEIMNNEIYDLKSTPTLYLLSKDKRVLLKNCDLAKIELYLSRANTN